MEKNCGLFLVERPAIAKSPLCIVAPLYLFWKGLKKRIVFQTGIFIAFYVINLSIHTFLVASI
jgi:hypothetical protein